MEKYNYKNEGNENQYYLLIDSKGVISFAGIITPNTIVNSLNEIKIISFEEYVAIIGENNIDNYQPTLSFDDLYPLDFEQVEN